MTLLALMAASLAIAPVAATDKADLRCIAIFSMMASEMPEEKAGVAGAIMFYIGRIEGRGAGLGLQAELNRVIDELVASSEMITTEAKRCGNEMVVKGEEVERIGSAISVDSPQPSGK